ncbi:MAG: GAF domain-containing protein, partial [Chloroflexota bacterium]|nr:GAF domain-containing protein [Chloroflexota bacterium]
MSRGIGGGLMSGLIRVVVGWLERPKVGAAAIFWSLQTKRARSRWTESIFSNASWLLVLASILITWLPLPKQVSIDRTGIAVVLGLYSLYVLFLEIASRKWKVSYDAVLFRIVRIVANAIVVSVLVWFSSGENSYFWFFYSLPVFQAIIYFGDLAAIGTTVGVVTIYCGTAIAVVTISRGTLDFALLAMNSLVLSLMAFVLYWLFGYAREKRRLEHEELVALQQTALDITAQLDRDRLLQTIIQRAVELLQAKGGGVYEYDLARGELTVVADWDGRHSIVGNKLKIGEGMAGRVVQTGKPLIVDDYATWPGRASLYEPDLFRAVVEVPLKGEDRILGVLYVTDDNKERVFTKRDADLLSLLASQAAIAIENAKLHQKVKSWAQQLDALDKITLDIAAPWEISTLLRAIIQRAAALLEAPGGGIYLLTGTGERFELGAVWGLPASLEGTIVEKDQGLVAQVVLQRHPLAQGDYHAWPSRLSMLDEYHLTAVAAAPILSGERILGAIAVHDLKPGRQFTDDELNVLFRFANHAAVAIEKARLFNEVSQRVEEMQRLLDVSQAVSSNLSLDGVLSDIVRLAGKVTGSDHTGVVLVDEEGRLVTSIEDRKVGAPLYRRARPEGITHKVIATRQPVVFDQVYNDGKIHNPVIVAQGFKSYAGVPIVSGGRVLGVLFVHSFRPNVFVERIPLLMLFASQAATPIQSALLERRLKQLELLEEVKQAVESALNLEQVLNRILRKGLEIVHADSGSMMLVDNKTHLLKMHAWFGSGWTEEKKKITFGIGTGIAGWVVEQKAACRCPDVLKDIRFIRPVFDPTIRSLLAVPILSHGRAIGVIDADSSEVDFFGAEDERLLNTLAAQVAIAIERARLLQALQEVGLSIVQAQPLDRVLQLVVEKSLELIGFSSGWVSLVNEQGKLEVKVATQPIDPQVKVDLEIDGQSISGWVAKMGQSLNISDVSKDSRYREFYSDTRSELAIPLMIQNRVVGVLNVESAEADFFDEYDVQMLTALANQAAVAVENVRLFCRLKQTGDRLSSMVASSFDGIIDIDVKGYLTGFNARAETIMGFKATEVLGKYVGELYYDPDEPRRIGRLLWSSREGKLYDYPTYVRGKPLGDTGDRRGEKIPVRLSTTWLFDSQGSRIGSVGFFRDWRGIQQVESERELLLKTMNSVAIASGLDEGLNVLAQNLVTGLTTTFCYIMLLDDSGQNLVVRAAYPVPRSSKLLWNPGVEKTKVDLTHVPAMRHLLAMVEARAFQKGECVEGNEIVGHVKKIVGLEGMLESVLVVPLRAGEQVFGICTFGEMRSWERAPYSGKRLQLACSSAGQAAGLFQRMRAQQTAERRFTELKHVQDVGEKIAQAIITSPKEVLDRIAQGVCEVIGADCGVIYPYYVETGMYDVTNIGYHNLYHPSKQFSPKLRQAPGSLSAIVLRQKRRLIVDDVTTGWDRDREVEIWAEEGSFLHRERVRSFAGLGLYVGDEPVGVLFVNFRRPHTFMDDELNTLQILASQATTALKNTLLHQETESKANQLSTLLKIGQDITAGLNLVVVLQHIVDIAVSKLGAEVAMLYAYDPEQDQMERSVTAGHLRHPEDMWGPVSRDTVVYRLIQETEPHLAHDARHDAVMAGGFVQREEIVSSAGFPLRVGGQPMGVMFVNYRSPHQFTVAEEEAFILFVQQAAIAIQNARRYKTVTDRLEVASNAALFLSTMSAWAHDAANETFGLRADAEALPAYLSNPSPKVIEILERLKSKAEKVATLIPDVPIEVDRTQKQAVHAHQVLQRVLEQHQGEIASQHIPVDSFLLTLPP